MEEQNNVVIETPEQPDTPLTDDKANKSSGISIAALCCGIACFFINPCYLTCIAAIVLGIIGLCQPGKKTLATVGLILGGVGIIAQFIVDLVLSIFTGGLSFLF